MPAFWEFSVIPDDPAERYPMVVNLNHVIKIYQDPYYPGTSWLTVTHGAPVHIDVTLDKIRGWIEEGSW